MWCFGLCLLNSFPILLKGTPAWEAGGVATAEDTFDWGSKLNTFSASTNVQRHLKGQRILILKDDLLLKKKKKKKGPGQNQANGNVRKSTLRTTLFPGVELHLWLFILVFT